MSKAFVQLNDAPLLDDSYITNTIKKHRTFSMKYIVYAVIVGVILLCLVYLWRSNVNNRQRETFNPDDPSQIGDFPARIYSNTTMNRSGKCHKPILRNGYIKPYAQTDAEKARYRKSRRVRWSDPLVEIMNT